MLVSNNNSTVTYLVQSISKAIKLYNIQRTMASVTQDTKADQARKYPLLNCIVNILKQIEKSTVPQARSTISQALDLSV